MFPRLKSTSLCGSCIALVLLLFTGCSDDPTSAGLGLVGDQAGDPRIVRVSPAVFQPGIDADVTGGDTFRSPSDPGASRVLVGSVADPALGDIHARGNLDLLPLTSPSDVFTNGTVSWAQLTLATDYVYGDTLSTMTFQLHDILDEWLAVGVRADSTVRTGTPVTDVTVSPTAASVVFDLPSTWLAQHDSDLRSTDLSGNFHGFQVTSSAGNAVVGFQLSGSSLRVAVPGDTITLQMTQSFTELEKEPIITNRGTVLIQDGTNARVDLEFDFDQAGLTGNAIHRALLLFQTTSENLETPTNFVRPPLTQLDLNIVAGDDESRTTIATITVGPDDQFSVDDSDLNTVVQNVVVGVGDLRRFELTAPIELNSLNVLFLRSGSTDLDPYLDVTMTPIN